MNGTEHYKRAERLVERSDAVGPEHATTLLAQAQVHATLALAAATLNTRLNDAGHWQESTR